MLLDRQSLAVRSHVSKDETRPALTGVLVKRDGTTVATDGYSLATVAPVPELDSAEYPHEANGNAPGAEEVAEDFILPADAADALVKALPKKTHLPILACACVDGVATNANGSARILTTDLNSWRETNARKVDSTFPKWEQVMPKDTPTVRLAVNADLLIRALKVAMECSEVKSGTRRKRVQNYETTIEIHADPDGTVFKAIVLKAGRYTGLVMPLRLPE